MPSHLQRSPMDKTHPWLLPISLLLLLHPATCESDDVKRSLVSFLNKLSAPNARLAQDLRWNASTDPCLDGWKGIVCNSRRDAVRKVILESLQLGGSIDASLLCKPQALAVVSLQNNSLQGSLMPEISNCSQLTHLLLSGNRLSGALPPSLSSLNNLKRFDVSDNGFSGEVPDGLAKISGLLTFVVQNNRLNGSIPQFDFENLQQFNVSDNLFTGPIPEDGDRFGIDSYSGNPGLCGGPVDKDCPPSAASSPQPEEKPKKKSKWEKALLVSGYAILALFIALFVVYKIATRKRTSEKAKAGEARKEESDKAKASSTSSGQKASRSEYSVSSNETAPAGGSMSLVVLKNHSVKELRFEELLKAPAELLGRGRFGSLYKVAMADGTALAVKRIKDWTVPAKEFQRRMERLDRARHPRVLPAIAFYCSKQEKLVVYEYRPNGSLFKLLHGSDHNSSTFDWSSRLSVAAGIAEGLAFMHQELNEVGIGHGNLKSSNILMDNDMEPCISEYGLLAIPKQGGSGNGRKSVNPINDSALKADIYGFGVIILELLTGKLVQNNGLDLAQWVNSVVREEWTAEVFDKALVSEGVIEEAMVRLLQVALKCIDSSTDARPAMSKVAKMIQSLKEDDDRSVPSEIDSREN